VNSLSYFAVLQDVEAYPGDIFYIHSRLLERATHLLKELGGLTDCPSNHRTEAQNISAYIPTNLISITDGRYISHIAFLNWAFCLQSTSAKSVSRVGGKAQHAAYRGVAGDLKLAYSQFEELEAFTRFGARLEETPSRLSSMGGGFAPFSSSQNSPCIMPEQIFILLALNAKLFDNVPLTE